MTLLTAARHVLTDAGTPLHTEELTRRMLEGGLWTTQGRTPAQSVYSALHMSLKRLGTSSPFVQTAPSTFGLRAFPAELPPVSPVVGPDHEAEASEDDAPAPATRTFLDAAEAVLASLPDGQPMRIRDLTETALQEGLLVTQGRTPAATMSAQISQDIERRQMRGLPPRFERLQAGFVRLLTDSQGTTGTGPDATTEPVTPLQRDLLARLQILDPRDFERLIEKLLAALGYVTVEVTPYSNDGGIDLRAEYTGGLIPERIAVQVKRQQANVGRPAIQNLRGSLAIHERGLFITTGRFTKGAREEALRPTAAPIGLLTGEALAGLLIQYRVGVLDVGGTLILQDNLLQDVTAEVEDADASLPPLIRDRKAAGLSVSAINDEGGDANLWEIDDEEELRLSRLHMEELRLRVMQREGQRVDTEQLERED